MVICNKRVDINNNLLIAASDQWMLILFKRTLANNVICHLIWVLLILLIPKADKTLKIYKYLSKHFYSIIFPLSKVKHSFWVTFIVWAYGVCLLFYIIFFSCGSKMLLAFMHRCPEYQIMSVPPQSQPNFDRLLDLTWNPIILSADWTEPGRDTARSSLYTRSTHTIQY